MTIQQLQQRLADLHAQAENIQAKADCENRDLTETERDSINVLFGEFDDVERELQTRQRLERQQTRMAEPQPRKTPPAMRRTNEPYPSGEFAPQPIPYPGEPSSVVSSFRAVLAQGRGQTDGFASLSQFMRAATEAPKGIQDPRLRVARMEGQNEYEGGAGGWMIPTQYIVEILEQAFATAGLLQRVRTIPMISNALNISGFGSHDHSGGYAGITGTWTGEAQSITVQTATVRALNLRAHKLAFLLKASNELLTDVPSTGSELAVTMGEALAAHLEGAILTGSGPGKPIGVLESNAAVVVTKESGQTAATVVWTNIVKMFSRLVPASHRTAVWIVSQSTLAQLLTVYRPIDDSGFGGSNGIVGGVPVIATDDAGGFRMLGLPVLVSEHAPALGSQGDIALFDPAQYVLGLKPQMAVETSGHVFFNTDETAFRLIARGDGLCRYAQAITPANGGDTVSPIVVLGARA